MRGGAFSSGVGRGEDENPRGGPGRGKKARKSANPKIRQKCVTEGFVLEYGVLTKENITLSDSYMVFLQTR